MKMRCLQIAVIAVLILGGFAPLSAAQAAESSSAKLIPVFELNRPITEAPLGDDALFGAAGVESFRELVRRMERVVDDKDVPAVVILAESLSLGRGQLEEVRKVMGQIKASGKKIYAHADSLSMSQYVLLSGCSHISVTPQAHLFITGMHAESLHLRGLLDRLGIEADYLTCGDYKSAGELFTRYEPTPAADENLRWLVDGIHEMNVQFIAAGRNQTPDVVRSWIDKGLYTAAEAKERGIVDAVEYRQDLVTRLRKEYGDQVKLERRYGKEKQIELDLSTPLGILKFYADLLSTGRPRKSTKDAVAIVYVEGPIVDGQAHPNTFPFGSSGIAYSTPIRKALDLAREDETVKAVVLRVNSPGGSAVGSEVILEATKRLKEKKPFVVSMGDVAGSGGYYVACGSDTIFADASTITASIGVVAGKLATKGLWDRWGIHWHEYNRGRNASLLYSARPFTPEQRDLVQGWMDQVYEVFKTHVRAARADRLKKDLEDLAGGRVYTGKQAYELGLVDAVAGLSDAIHHAAKQAGLTDYEVRVLPPPKNVAQLLTESLTGEDSSGPVLGASRLFAASSPDEGMLAQAVAACRAIDPPRARSLEDALWMLRILRTEGVVLNMPIIHFHENR